MTPEAITTHLKSILIAFQVLDRAIPRRVYSGIQQPVEALMLSYRSMLDQLAEELHGLEQAVSATPSEPPTSIPPHSVLLKRDSDVLEGMLSTLRNWPAGESQEWEEAAGKMRRDLDALLHGAEVVLAPGLTSPPQPLPTKG